MDLASGGPASTTARDESPSNLRVAPPPPPVVEDVLEVEAPPMGSMPQVLTRDHPLAKAPHPLDAAPVNSKLVVVDAPDGAGRVVVLATTDARPRVLPRPNPAYALPAGTKIHKRGPRQFVGELPDGMGEFWRCQGESTHAVVAELSHKAHDREVTGSV